MVWRGWARFLSFYDHIISLARSLTDTFGLDLKGF